MEIVDSHAHLNDSALKDDIETIIKNNESHHIGKVLIPGWDIESSRLAIEISSRHDGFYSAVGIHPENIEGLTLSDVRTIEELAKNEKVIAIGEIGLDLHYRSDDLPLQMEFLRSQLDLSIRLGLPFIVHMRDCTGEFMDFIRKYRKEKGIDQFKGIMHSYSGSIETMNELISMGFLISFSGPVTFKNARIQKECAASCPIDKLLVETDSPYLSPEPFRGKRNEPKNTYYTLKYISELKNVDIETLSKSTTDNFNKLFNLED